MSKNIPVTEIFSILSEFHGDLSLYVELCDSEEKFTINPEMRFPACSVIKIPLLGLLLSDAENGIVDLDKPHQINPANRVGGTGILCDMSTSLKPTLRDLAKLMIVMSDNIATNEIIDVVGVDRFHDFCKKYECSHFLWQRKMMDFEAARKGRDNWLVGGETGVLVSKIAKGEFVNKKISKTIFEYMCSQKYRNKLPALIPAIPSYSGVVDKVPNGSVLCANKTGDLVGVQHDVGIFQLPDNSRYVIAMFTKNLKADVEGVSAIAKVSKAVYLALA